MKLPQIILLSLMGLDFIITITSYKTNTKEFRNKIISMIIILTLLKWGGYFK